MPHSYWPQCVEEILHLVEATGKLARGQLCLFDFKFGVVNGGSIKNQTADAISKLETGGRDSTEMDDYLTQVMGSLMKHRGGRSTMVMTEISMK